MLWYSSSYKGEGTITSDRIEYRVKPIHVVPVGKDKDRGIRCDQRMILLFGIREDV